MGPFEKNGFKWRDKLNTIYDEPKTLDTFARIWDWGGGGGGHVKY